MRIFFEVRENADRLVLIHILAADEGAPGDLRADARRELAAYDTVEVWEGRVVDAVRAPHAIVSSNTSGISLAAIAEGRSAGFRAHWLGTHFFNDIVEHDMLYIAYFPRKTGNYIDADWFRQAPNRLLELGKLLESKGL